MDRRKFGRLIAASSATALLPGSAGRAPAAEPLKVGFVYLGPVGDFGWSYQHDYARKTAIEKYGDAIKTTFVENVPEGPDSEKVLTDLANGGNQLIFATSFGYMNYTLKAAKKFPKVFFEHATGYKRDGNVSTYNIRFYQGRFVQGLIAGHLSKSGVAGYVAAVPVPEVVQGLNAFMLGMRSVKPDAKLKFIMVNSWYDPPKEGDAAKALMDQGCDIITQHTDSPAPLQAAAGRGVKAFGQSTDMAKFADTTQLTASVDLWGPYYIKRIDDVMKDTWTSTDTWGGFAEGMLTMSSFANMPPDVSATATKAVADITAGTNKVFVGPLTDQAGAVRVAAGVAMDDKALNEMQWLVQGVEGKLS
jgi:basic membrane protein A and related proteins